MAQPWSVTLKQYSSVGLYVHFAIGRDASRVFWVVSQDAINNVDDFAVGTFTQGTDGDSGEYPGPTLFTLPSTFAGQSDIKGLLVDDSGPSPIFYVLSEEDAQFFVSKIDSLGTVLDTLSVSLDFPTVSFIGKTIYGLIIKSRTSDPIDFTPTTDLWTFDLQLNSSNSWLTAPELGARITASGKIWAVGFDLGTFPEWSARLYDSDGGFVDEYELPPGAPSSTGFDCVGEKLLWAIDASET